MKKPIGNDELWKSTRLIVPKRNAGSSKTNENKIKIAIQLYQSRITKETL